MSNSYDSYDWGEDPFEGDIDFDTNFDSSEKHGFLRSVATGFLSGIVEQTVGDTDARVNTLKMVLPKTWTNTFSVLAEINRRKSQIIREFKAESHGSMEDLQYLAKRAAAKIDKVVPNKITDTLTEFSQHDFSSWEEPGSSGGSGIPSMENVNESDVSNLLNSEEVNSIKQRETAVQVGESITTMITEVGARTIGGINTMNMSLSKTNMLLEDILDYNRKVQMRNDAMKINIMARHHLTSAKYYKFVEASNHAMIKHLKLIATNSSKSDYEKTTHSQAARKSIRDSVFTTAKSSFGGIADFITERFGKNARSDQIGNIGELASSLRMALEMSEGMPINYGQMIGSTAASMFIKNLPRMAKSPKGREYVEKFKKNFPELGKWADTAWAKITDVGNIASYGLTNAEGTANTLADFYQYGYTSDNQHEDYDEYLASLAPDEKPIGKARWSLNNVARKGVNKAAGSVLDDMYKSQGSSYNVKRRTLADSLEVEPWKRRDSRTLNEKIPELLSQIHLSVEKLRTGDNTLQAQTYDYLRGGMVDQKQRREDTFSRVLDKNQFSSHASAALRSADGIGGNELSPAGRRTLAKLMARNSDKKKGFSPYHFMDLENQGEPKAIAQEIRALMGRRFGVTQDIFDEFKAGDEAQRIAKLNVLPTKEGRELAAKVSSEVNNLNHFLPNISEKLDLHMADGGYNELLGSKIVKKVNGSDTVNTDLLWEIFEDFLKDPEKATVIRHLEDISETDTKSGPSNPYRRDLSNLSGPRGRGLRGKLNRRKGGVPEFIPGATTPVLEETATNPFNPADYSTRDLQSEGNKLLSEIKETVTSVIEQFRRTPLSGATGGPDYSGHFDELKSQSDKTTTYLENLVTLASTRNDTLTKILEGQGQANKPKMTEAEEKEVKAEKASIIDRIKNSSFRDMFNSGVGKLLDHEPLLLGGLLGSLAGLAVYNPKAAALIGGGFAAASVYGKIRNMAIARQAKDIEDLYEEGTDVPILEVFKLRRGDYYDMLTKRVIDAWDGITGSVRDITNGAIIGAKRLSGKLFTADNKEVFIKGLNSFREMAIKAFKWFDPFNRIKGITDKVSTRFYQMDVYVEGEKEPRLMGNMFAKDVYFIKNDSNELTPIKGWNEITGPVYDRNGNILISQEDFDRGLKTSMGVSVNKLGDAVGKAKKWGLELLGLAKDKAKAHTQGGWDKAKGALTADYTPIVSSVDRIYHLLMRHWGYTPTVDSDPYETPDPDADPDTVKKPKAPTQESVAAPVLEDVPSPYTPETSPGAPKYKPVFDQNTSSILRNNPSVADTVNKANSKLNEQLAKEAKDSENKPVSSASTADVNRANSVADRAKQAADEKNSQVKDAVIDIAQSLGVGLNLGEKGSGDKPKGLFALMGSMLGGIGAGISRLTGFFGNPILWSGLKALFTFSTFGISLLPKIATGIAAVATGIMTLIKTGSLGAAGADALGRARGRRRTGGPRPPQSGGRRFAGGAGKVGLGLGIAYGADALMSNGMVDEDSGAGQALNAVGTAATVYGGYQMVQAAGSMVGLDLGVAGLGRLGLQGALSLGRLGISGAIAAGPVLLNPFVLGALAVGAAGYGIYKFITRGEGKQIEIRMAQYGLPEADSPLGEKIRQAEEMLKDFVVIGNGRASINKSAPLEQVLELFTAEMTDKRNVGEVYTWFNGRFKPVFLTYMACLDVVKIKSLKEYDEGKTQDIYKVAYQSHQGLLQQMPRPYGVVAKIDPETPLMAEKQTIIKVGTLLDELKKYVDRKSDSKDLEAVETTVGQSKESMEKERMTLEQKLNNPDANWKSPTERFQANKRLNEVKGEIAKLDSVYKANEVVAQIYVNDLLPDGQPMDMLTAIRVACYGNEENLPWRVEAVLKLERHCEALFNVNGDKVDFKGNIGELFNRFKAIFRVDDDKADDWCLWFRDRFLPVMTNYITILQNYRRGKPGVVWKTLSATGRYEIAKSLIETQVNIGGLTVSVWYVKASPFNGTYSVRKYDKVDRMLALLGEASTIAKLKDPEMEAGKTNASTWAKEISPHKPGGDYTDKAANVQAANNYQSKRDALIGGQYGPNGAANSNHITPYGVMTTPDNQFGYQPITGDSETSHLDMSGVQANQGTDSGVSVPRKLAEQLIIREMLKQGFTDPRAIAEMLALTNYESGGYQKTTENMKYTSPENLMKTFREVTSLDQARRLISAGEVAIANTVYGGGKGASIGNKLPGDGYSFRGRGFVQLTGRENYRKIGQELGIDLENNPQLASTDPNVMAAIAVNFFKNNKLLQSITQTGDFGKAATGLNGGNALPGMGQRYQLYLNYLKQLQEGNLKADDSALTSEVGGQTANELYGNTAPAASGGNPSGNYGSGNAPPPMVGGGNLPSMSGSQYGTPAANSGNYTTPYSFNGDTGGLVNSNSARGTGLRLKSEETVGGGEHHPGLEALCEMIQERVPGFKQFTALNDRYHVNKGSKGLHPRGLAADFTLTNGIDGSDRAVAIATEILRQAGLTPKEFSVLNEYRKKTALGTGGHVHVGFRSPGAAQKFLEASGGNQPANNQDTTGGNMVNPVNPTVPGGEAPTKPTPVEQQVPVFLRRPPPMGNPAITPAALRTENDGVGSPDDDEYLPKVLPEPKLPPRQTKLPLPVNPPKHNNELPEGYEKNKERYANGGGIQDKLQDILAGFKDSVKDVSKADGDHTELLAAVVKRLDVLINQNAEATSKGNENGIVRMN